VDISTEAEEVLNANAGSTGTIYLSA
jgi:hypothetical protein